MGNQEIIYIDRTKDVIIVQSESISYQDTLVSFALDYGLEVPEYIQKLDICRDTGLKMLNGSDINEKTEHGADVIAYADMLIPKAQDLQDAKESRENPAPPEMTEEELELQTKQEELRQKEVELEKIDKQLFNLMCQDFANRLQEIQTLPETKEEMLVLFTQKDSLTKEIEDLNQHIKELKEEITTLC